MTAATALGLVLAILPVVHMAFVTGRASSDPSGDHASRVAGFSVFAVVALLAPMGGDGVTVGWSDARLVLGLVLAAGLLVTGMTDDYNRLEWKGRLVLQSVYAFTAMAIGLQPAGVTPDLVAWVVGMVVLLVCANAIALLDRRVGLVPVTGVVMTTFLALAAHRLGVASWCDLNLGLCGALLALLALQRSRDRFRVHLGEGSCLCIGFLIGMTLLRLSPQALSGTRWALALVVGIPLLEISFVLGSHALAESRDQPRGTESSMQERLATWGLTHTQILALYAASCGVTSLAALRMLHLLD